MRNSYSNHFRLKHVKAYLNQKELTLLQYAESIGINISTFSNWVYGYTHYGKCTYDKRVKRHSAEEVPLLKKKKVLRTEQKIEPEIIKSSFIEDKMKGRFIDILFGSIIVIILIISIIVNIYFKG